MLNTRCIAYCTFLHPASVQFIFSFSFPFTLTLTLKLKLSFGMKEDTKQTKRLPFKQFNVIKYGLQACAVIPISLIEPVASLHYK